MQKMQKCKKLKSTQKCKIKLGASYQYKKTKQAEGLGTLDLVQTSFKNYFTNSAIFACFHGKYLYFKFYGNANFWDFIYW